MQSFSSMPTKTGFIPETDSPKKKSPQPEAGHDLGSWQFILDDFFCICIKHLLKNEDLEKIVENLENFNFHKLNLKNIFVDEIKKALKIDENFVDNNAPMSDNNV